MVVELLHDIETVIMNDAQVLPYHHQSLPSLVSPTQQKVSVKDMKRQYLSEVSERQRIVTSSEEIHKVLEEEQLLHQPWPRSRLDYHERVRNLTACV